MLILMLMVIMLMVVILLMVIFCCQDCIAMSSRNSYNWLDLDCATR